MDPVSFRRRVLTALGPELSQATPDNVRALVAELQAELARTHGDRGVVPTAGRYVLPDTDAPPPLSLEASVKAFLGAQLVGEPETARQRLWLALLELWFAVLAHGEEERLAALFAGLE